MSSDLYSKQTSSSPESSSLSGQTLNDYLVLPDGNRAEYESQDVVPSRSTLEPSIEGYSGAVCHGTVSVVPCQRGNHIEMRTHIESIIDGTDRENIVVERAWQSDMDQAHINFTSTSTLKIAIKSGAFSTFDSLATFARSLMHNPCCSITLDVGQENGSVVLSSDTERATSSTTSVAEWVNVVLEVMDLGELDNDGACVMRCEFMGADVTRTLNLYLCPDRDHTEAISVIRHLVSLDGSIELGSMDIGASSTTIQSILPMFFEEVGSRRGLKLCRPPPSNFRPLSVWCGRHPETLVVEVTENGATALLDWLCQMLENQPNTAPPKLTLRFSSRAVQEVQQRQWEKLDELLFQRTRSSLKLESLDEGITVAHILRDRLPQVLHQNSIQKHVLSANPSHPTSHAEFSSSTATQRLE